MWLSSSFSLGICSHPDSGPHWQNVYACQQIKLDTSVQFTPNDIMVPIDYLLQGEVIEPFWAPLFAGQVYIVDWQGHRLRVPDDKITLSSRITSAISLFVTSQCTRLYNRWHASTSTIMILNIETECKMNISVSTNNIQYIDIMQERRSPMC